MCHLYLTYFRTHDDFDIKSAILAILNTASVYSGIMENAQASKRRFEQTGLLGYRSLLIVLVPAISLILIILSLNLVLLDYIHVLSGGLWTGIDIFMGLVIGRILPKMSIQTRVEFIKRMVPYMLFLMPTLASVAITAGIYLATGQGIFDVTYPVFITAGIIVIFLLVQGFGIFLPNELRIYLELRKENPDSQKIGRLGMINFKLSGVQAIFQVLLIFVMANIASANYFFQLFH